MLEFVQRELCFLDATKRMAFVCFLLLGLITIGSSTKRCRRVCESEIEVLTKRIEALEEKLTQLIASSKGEPIILRKGVKGDPGPPGPKGDKGERGLTGLTGKQGPPCTLALPKCGADEHLSSDGSSLICFKQDKSERDGGIDRKVINGEPFDRQPGIPMETPDSDKHKMTRFMKKYMIQALYTDTWDLHSFSFQGKTFLGMSRLSDQTFSMYLLHRDSSFLLKTTLAIPNTRKWTSFEWEGNCYVVIACNDNAREDEQAYSYVYKLVNDQLLEFQKLPTRKAFGVTAVEAEGKMYVIFVYMYSKTSDTFRWERTSFVKHSSIPVQGADIQAFKIGSRIFLAAVGTTTEEESVYLLEYQNNDFRTYANIDVESRGFGVKHVQVQNEHFLAVARIDKSSSLVLKWNGMSFERFQSVDSCNARDFATVRTTSGSQEFTYIAVVSYTCRPVIYVYDNVQRKQFVKLQETESMWTRDMEFINVVNTGEVLLAVSTKTVTSIYAGSRS